MMIKSWHRRMKLPAPDNTFCWFPNRTLDDDNLDPAHPFYRLSCISCSRSVLIRPSHDTSRPPTVERCFQRVVPVTAMFDPLKTIKENMSAKR
jgi:hypothetical protein